MRSGGPKAMAKKSSPGRTSVAVAVATSATTGAATFANAPSIEDLLSSWEVQSTRPPACRCACGRCESFKRKEPQPEEPSIRASPASSMSTLHRYGADGYTRSGPPM